MRNRAVALRDLPLILIGLSDVVRAFWRQLEKPDASSLSMLFVYGFPLIR